MNHDSPSDIRILLQERGLALKKRWGQNFLVNRGARERLLMLLDPGAGETIWEIGPGLGAMTAELLERARLVVAFEVDRGLCRFLEESFSHRPSFILVPGDFLQTWRVTASARSLPDRVIGNLPYSSASIMIAALIEGSVRPRTMIFTVQRELAERMASPPGRKSYSSFSVLCQASCRVLHRGDLKPGSFYPAPDVVSSVVELQPRHGCRNWGYPGAPVQPGPRPFCIPEKNNPKQSGGLQAAGGCFHPGGAERDGSGRHRSCRARRADWGRRFPGAGAPPYRILSSFKVVWS